MKPEQQVIIEAECNPATVHDSPPGGLISVPFLQITQDYKARRAAKQE